MLHAVNKVTGECGQKILPSLDRKIKESNIEGKSFKEEGEQAM